MPKSVISFTKILSFLILAVVMTVHAQNNTANLLLEQINELRVVNGLPELLTSQELLTASLKHSQDMANTQNLSHVGSDGTQFWDRMQASGFALTNGVELVLASMDDNAANWLSQWSDSPTHRDNLLNPEFSEVGAGVALSGDGNYYITVLLGVRERIDVNVEEVESPIILTPLPTFTPVPSPTINSLPSTPVPTLLAPPTPTSAFQPPVPEATQQTSVVDNAATQVVPTGQAATQVVQNAAQIQQPVYRAGATLSPLQVYATQTAPTLTPAPTQRPADIRMIYDADSFSLVNVSGRILDLQDLSFISNAGEMPATSWETQFLTQPLSNFLAEDCLQIRANASVIPDKPSSCRTLHGWIPTNDDNYFWVNAEVFIVQNSGQPVGFCTGYVGTCDLSLLPPDNLVIPSSAAGLVSPSVTVELEGTSEQTDDSAISRVIGPNDVRLIYDDISFSVVNTSDRILDLSSLTFESDGGVYAASTWNNDFNTRSIADIPPGDCVQIWTINSEVQSRPDICETRHSWNGVAGSQLFWIDVEGFRVRNAGTEILICSRNNTTCDFDMP